VAVVTRVNVLPCNCSPEVDFEGGCTLEGACDQCFHHEPQFIFFLAQMPTNVDGRPAICRASVHVASANAIPIS
jgi:hypothetical protein